MNPVQAILPGMPAIDCHVRAFGSVEMRRLLPPDATI